jgi:hypothetical protein
MHPSIRRFANCILFGQDIEYEGDPLLDFALGNFLDRISFKEPKSEAKLDKFKER